MNKVILATRNKGKIKEFMTLLAPFPIQPISAYDLTEPIEVVEDAHTFVGNAEKKALAYLKHTGLPALADDSGLAVDFLDGKPGVHSARFAGDNATDAENNIKLINLLDGVPAEKRTAQFTSAIALALPDGQLHTVEGKCHGIITREQTGDRGFGYDPLFFVPEINKTYAQMDDEQKNRISHRAIAIQKLRRILESIWGQNA